MKTRRIKHIFTAILVGLFSFETLAQYTLPFYEDFQGEQLPAGWQVIDSASGTSTFTFSVRPNNPGLTTEENGYAHISGNTVVRPNAHLISPSIDMSGASGVMLSFDNSFYNSDVYPLKDYIGVYVSDDGGVTWGDTTYFNDAYQWPPERDQIDISAIAAGKSNVKIRFAFVTQVHSDNPSWSFDDIAIHEIVSDDLGIVSWDSKTKGCDIDSVNVIVHNYGTNPTPATGFDIGYSTDNGATYHTEHVNDVIQPNSSMTYKFTSLMSLSPGTYNGIVKCTLAGDFESSNDELSMELIKSPVVSSFPYSQDFEGAQAYWFSSNGISSWELGTPDNTLTNSASGTNCWITDIDGDYVGNEFSWVESPYFDFSGLTKPIFRMNAWWQIDNPYSDGVQLEYRIAGSNIWTVIGNTASGSNWYNSVGGWSGFSNTWIPVEHDLDMLSGYSAVQLRLRLKSVYTYSDEGFAFDDVEIYESPAIDLGISAWEEPSTGCGLSNAETIRFKVSNYGADAAPNEIPLKFSLDNGQTYTHDTLRYAIPVATDISYMVLSLPQDFSVPGVYNIIVLTDVPGDGQRGNDTLRTTVVSQPTISTFPVTEDFETSSGDLWVTSSSSSINSWELATPNGIQLSGANSGSNAWVTNASQNYKDDEISYVNSPCYDFSGLEFPAVELQSIADVYTNDAVTLQYSTDGSSWSILEGPQGGDTVNNWYHGNLGWRGTWNSYMESRKGLQEVGNPQRIQFRIELNANFQYVGEGFAFDDFTIYSDSMLFSPDTIIDDSVITDTTIVDTTISDTTTTGIIFYKDVFEINAFPNPASERVYIQLIGSLKLEDVSINVISSIGQKLNCNIHFNNSKEAVIDTKELPGGMYFLRVWTDDQITVKPFVINHN